VRAALWVALGGAIGSVARWLLSGAVQRWAGNSFPWGTFTVNAIGSLLVGALAALALERALISPAARQFLIVGVLGGFTTFSAFSYEAVALLREGQWWTAAGYVGGSVTAGLGGAMLGVAVGLRL